MAERQHAVRRRQWVALSLALVVASAVLGTGGRPPAAAAQPAAVVAAWVALGPEGSATVRAVARGPACPSLAVDGQAVPMAVRAAPAPPAFPDTVCEAALPAGATGMAVGGLVLPQRRPAPQRIAVLGDTGCRLKEGDPIQDCNDPAAWPLARVAASAAAWQPDLVVHVGDYLYREMPCPPKHAGCAGSPWGDNWAAWDADFFAPVAPLLRAAPWVFVRGNHELCSRGGDGWFRYLAPGPMPRACTDFSPPYAVALDGLRLLVLDSAAADDRTAHPEQVGAYAQQYAALWEQVRGPAWLLQHKPLWAIGQGDPPGPGGLFRANPTLQAATGNALPPAVGLVLSGHLHNWELLTFADGRAAQLLVGNSGTGLDPPLSVSLAGLEIAGTTVATGRAWHEHGFVTLEPRGDAWEATLRAVDGAPVLVCTLAGGAALCAP
jgi:hypothetical protein